jgi:hypothetical protein
MAEDAPLFRPMFAVLALLIKTSRQGMIGEISIKVNNGKRRSRTQEQSGFAFFGNFRVPTDPPQNHFRDTLKSSLGVKRIAKRPALFRREENRKKAGRKRC